MTQPTPQQEFAQRLYTDHLEEIDFLLAQRLTLFDDPEVEWPDIAEFEERLMANVRAVVRGGDEAVPMLAEMLQESDIDIVRSAVFTLLHIATDSAHSAILESLQAADDDLIVAYVDALKHAPSTLPLEPLKQLLSHESSSLRCATIDILGYRRQGNPQQFAERLKDEHPLVVRASIVALQRMRHLQAADEFRKLLKHTDPTVSTTAALAMAVFNDASGCDWLRSFCRSTQDDYAQAPVYLALVGALSDADLLMQSPVAQVLAAIEGLGIIGAPESLDYLLPLLKTDDDETKLAAAKALELIAASGMTEEHVDVEVWEDPFEGVNLGSVSETKSDDDDIDDTDDEDTDEDIDEEDESDSPEEEDVTSRVSTSFDQWSVWLKENRSRFKAGRRYRCGKPFTTELLIEELTNPLTSGHRRRMAHIEIQTRQLPYQDFETDWFIKRQLKALEFWSSS